jgi:hypothetical protein
MLMYPSENPGECNRHYIVAMELRFKKWRLPKVVGG